MMPSTLHDLLMIGEGFALFALTALIFIFSEEIKGWMSK